MSKSIKPKNNVYLSSAGVVHGNDHRLLSEILEDKFLVESGSNSNGEYKKFSDGTLICFGAKNYTPSTLSDYWSTFNRTDWVNVSFPTTFIAVPIVFAQSQSSTTTSIVISSITTSLFSCCALKSKNATDQNFLFNFFAIGRWK